MGVENADDAATWKATMSILRRQKLLPLLDACEEEDIIISIMILCLSCSFALRSVQESKQVAGGEQSGQVVLWRPTKMMVWCVVNDGGLCCPSCFSGRCVFKFVPQWGLAN